MNKNHLLLSYAIAFLAVLLTGCGKQEAETMSPEAVAERFVSSLTRKDWDSAFSVTLPAFREAIETNREAYSPVTSVDLPVRVGKTRRSGNHATVQVQLVFPSRVNTAELALVRTNGQWLVESL
ncbi:MAG: hypothetical protein IJR99_07945 [Kiritimatiellae bacterium]|nr:hypothetical protein [Kiritimatiellia bacterium]